MHKAIFLDRDGVLNAETGYIVSHHFFKILDHAPVQLKRLKEAGYLLIVVTNQGGIAKGLYSHDDLRETHQKLIDEMKMADVELTDIFYCPHHPDVSKCLCRKPGSLMLEKAIAMYQVDTANSFLIGDADRDIQAADAAGVRSFKIEPNADWSVVVDEILK